MSCCKYFRSIGNICMSEADHTDHVMRILIVEDEPLIALSTQADLEAAGHTVVGIAMTSREAFESG